MIKLQEMVPYEKVSDIDKKLKEKYADLGEGTFGIDMEFHTNDPDAEPDPHDHIDQFYSDMLYGGNDRSWTAYNDWLEELRSKINRNYGGDNWNDDYGPIDVDRWEEYHEEPEREEYETEKEYNEAEEEWNTEREVVDDVYNKWERYDKSDYINDWIDEIVSNGEWSEYFDIYVGDDERYNENTESDITNFIEEMTGKVLVDSGWEVENDGGDIVEIATPPLKYTQKNLDDFFKVMDYCNQVAYVAGDVSAHVHVGMPEDTDAFDLIAMCTLVDENAIKKDISADRDLESWSALMDKLHTEIFRAIKGYISNELKMSPIDYEMMPVAIGKNFMISYEKLYNKLVYLSRYMGTNITAYRSHKTVEFRYFSSQVVNKPQVFEKWIKYFLLLPKIAQSKNQVIIGKDLSYPLVFTRIPGDKVQVNVISKDMKKLPKKPYEKSSDIRKSKLNVGPGGRKEKIKNKLKKQPQTQFPFMRRPNLP